MTNDLRGGRFEGGHLLHCRMCQREHADSTSRALAELASTPGRLDVLVSPLSPRQASFRPAPDKWSPKEIVCHLADCELVYGFRYRKLIAEPASELAAFEQDDWAHRLEYQNQSLKSALGTFIALRRQNLALLRSLPRDGWSQGAHHPEYGSLDLHELVVHLADHDRNHVGQIDRIVSPLLRRTRRKKKKKTKK